MKSRQAASTTMRKTKKQSKRNWQFGYSDPWIRILEMLSKMSFGERHRCIRATVEFYRNK